MARKGVTQEQVNVAADSLLVAGERPTIERVRATLGTGSPNTLTRCLDVWWRQLGARLNAHEAKLALPDAPEAVVTAASQLWLGALEHAQVNARAALEEESRALSRARRELADEREHLQQQVKNSMAIADVAQAAREQAEGRLADLDRLVTQQAAQLTDLQEQRAQAVSARDRLYEDVKVLRLQLAEAQTRAQTDQAAVNTRHQAEHDRWLQEVDRARQEVKRAEEKLRSVESEAVAEVRQAQSNLQELQNALLRTEGREQAALARASTLEEQVRALQERLAELARGRSTDARRSTSSAPPSTASSSRRKPRDIVRAKS